jgi:hypothetical protein
VTAGNSEGRPAGTGPTSISLNATNTSRVIESGEKLQELAEHIDGAFVVLLRYPSGRHHRRCFLTLKAAEHAAVLALSRGQSVEVVLAELKPLYRVLPSLREAS